MKQACCLAYGHLSVYVRLVLCLQESLFVCVGACVCVCVRACVHVRMLTMLSTGASSFKCI